MLGYTMLLAQNFLNAMSQITSNVEKTYTGFAGVYIMLRTMRVIWNRNFPKPNEYAVNITRIIITQIVSPWFPQIVVTDRLPNTKNVYIYIGHRTTISHHKYFTVEILILCFECHLPRTGRTISRYINCCFLGHSVWNIFDGTHLALLSERVATPKPFYVRVELARDGIYMLIKLLCHRRGGTQWIKFGGWHPFGPFGPFGPFILTLTYVFCSI